jgi:hypothetical protein
MKSNMWQKGVVHDIHEKSGMPNVRSETKENKWN